MKSFERASYVIPDGVIERTVGKKASTPNEAKDRTIVEVWQKEIQETVGNKYEVVGVPCLPGIAAVALTVEEMKELKESYASAAIEVRAELRERIAGRAALYLSADERAEV